MSAKKAPTPFPGDLGRHPGANPFTGKVDRPSTGGSQPERPCPERVEITTAEERLLRDRLPASLGDLQHGDDGARIEVRAPAVCRRQSHPD
jgi:hypothetical protein